MNQQKRQNAFIPNNFDFNLTHTFSSTLQHKSLNMKKTSFLQIIFVVSFSFVSILTCQAQKDTKSIEREADSLALQMKTPNEQVNRAWSGIINSLNQKTSIAEELAIFINKTSADTILESKGLRESIISIKNANQSSEILINKDLFIIFKQKMDVLNTKLSKALIYVETKGLSKDPYFVEFQEKMNGVENSMNIQRRKYTETVNTYNLKLRKITNSMFYKKYPHLGKKQLFQAANDSNVAPKVQF